MKQKAGVKKRRGVIIAAIGTFLGAVIIALPSFGIELPLEKWIFFLFSFSVTPYPLWLLPSAFLLFVWSIILIVNRRRPVVLTFQLVYSFLIAYTLHSLAHLLQESPWPIFRSALLEASDGVRSASFKLVVLFIGEMILLIIIMLINDAVKHRRRSVEEPEVEELEESATITLTAKETPPRADFPNLDELPLYVDRTPPPPPSKRTKSVEPPVEEIRGENTVSLAMFRRLSEEVKKREEAHQAPPPAEVERMNPIDEKKGAKELPGLMLAAVKRMEEQKQEGVEEKPRSFFARHTTLKVEEKVDHVRQKPPVIPPVLEPTPQPVTPPPPPVEEPEVVSRVSVKIPPSPPPAVVEEVSEDDPLESSRGVGGLSALITKPKIGYQFPSESILKTYEKIGDVIDEHTRHQGELLVDTLLQFNIQVEVTRIVRGPTVTMFEVLPAPGIRVGSIVSLSDNIALALAATQLRIVAPIPGKSAVGIEIPNKKRDIIGFKEMLSGVTDSMHIPMVLGRTILDEKRVIDMSSSPHLLVAGSTGSGKSVCINSLICTTLFRRTPKEVRMILVDPKIVELNIYNGIPHLLTPVITDAKRTLKAFDFCLFEMERRYNLLRALNVRNITGYNEKIVANRLAREKLPYIMVVIDEFADLMHTVGKELETKVARLAAMSRAVGIHMVLATQRPSADVITGVIKANIPSRISFAVTSAIDSRIILDEMGAEKLLGRGDMLLQTTTSPATERIQGAFLSDAEVEEIVAFATSQGEPEFIDESFFEDDPPPITESSESFSEAVTDEELMEQALQIVVERKGASASYLQRRLKIGYNRAARLVEQMEEDGYVGPANGSKPRELLRIP
ncbi:MAG: DNA translocase FtsK [Sphaerochaeta sp.]